MEIEFQKEEPCRKSDATEPDGIKPALSVLPPELETVTGEEDEEVLWSGEGTLYEFDQTWKERGQRGSSG